MEKTGADAAVFGVNMKIVGENGDVDRETCFVPDIARYTCRNIGEITDGPIRYMYGIPADDTNDVLFFDRLKYSAFLWSWCWCYRKKILLDEKIRFCEDLKLREDGIFNCMFLAHADTIAAIPSVEYDYYKRSDGAASVFSHSSVEIENKILLVKYRLKVRDVVFERTGIDISEWTYGSYALSVIQLCVALAGTKHGYSAWKEYMVLEEVKKAVKAVPLKGKPKLVAPLLLCKLHQYPLLYCGISILKKMKVPIKL